MSELVTELKNVPRPLTSLDEEEQLFQETVRDFANQRLKPHVAEMDQAGKFRSDLLEEFFELGLMGIEIPEEYGGAGATFFIALLAVEELSRIDASAGVIVDVQNTLVNRALLTWGTEEQKRVYLPKLTREWVGGYCLSEAGSGSDAFALTTRAEPDGGDFVITGQKLWITNGAEAELFVVFAQADPEAGYKGITAFLVERESSGVEVGKKEDKLGIRASSTTELVLDACRVPGKNVLGPVGKGYKIAIETLNEGRIGIGAQMIGISQGALDCALAYSKERKAFGRPISDFQGVQFDLARMSTAVEASRLMVYNAARLKETGQSFVSQAAMVKYFTSMMAEEVTSSAVEIFGGYGYSKDYPVEKYYRDAKIGKIYEGTTNMQLATIAKLLLR